MAMVAVNFIFVAERESVRPLLGRRSAASAGRFERVDGGITNYPVDDITINSLQ